MSNRRRDTLPRNRKTTIKGGPASQRRISRREREEKQRKQLYIGLVVAAVISVVIVLGFGLNEYWFKPRTVLASVNGTEIRRRDYWKVRSNDLVNQVNQYQQFAQLVDASQQQQYITLAQQAAAELQDVWGSTDIDDATLTKMVEDQVYLQSLGDMGITITDQDIKTYIDSQFQPSDAPIISPTPSPTLIPQRAEWATQTETALRAEDEGTATATPTVAGGSPVAGSPVGSPVVDEASPIGSPIATEDSASPIVPAATTSPVQQSPTAAASPAASSEASPVAATPSVAASAEASPVLTSPTAEPTVAASPIAASPVAGSPTSGSPTSGSPVTEASPVGSATATAASTETAAPTPDQTQAVQTAEAGFKSYKDIVFDETHMSQSDYVRLVVRPAIARQRVEDQLLKDVGQTAPQVEASHILVDTKDLADQIYAEIQGGADFAQTAKDQSNDTATAENGGDLGWFAKGQMVQQFEDVAFSLQPGQVSPPFQTQYGWHIVKVNAVDPNRALTDQQMTQYRDAIVSRWLDAEKAKMKITSKVEPTPTPAVSSFVPPPDAPPLPTATTAPEASPVDEGTPVTEASPVVVASPVGSPVASPVASPAP